MARRSVCVPLIRTAFIFSLVLLSSPAIAQKAVSDSNQVGYPPFGTFSGSNFDQVAFQNGNLHISIPIQSLTQRNGKTYTWQNRKTGFANWSEIHGRIRELSP
jgi:hypothetical protein